MITVTAFQSPGISAYLQKSIPVIVMDRQGGIYTISNIVKDSTRLRLIQGMEASETLQLAEVRDRATAGGALEPGVVYVEYGSSDSVQIPRGTVFLPEGDNITLEDVRQYKGTISFYSDSNSGFSARDFQQPPELDRNYRVPYVGATPAVGPPGLGAGVGGERNRLLTKEFCGECDQFTRPIGVDLEDGETPIRSTIIRSLTSTTGGIAHYMYSILYIIEDDVIGNLLMSSRYEGVTGYDELPVELSYDKFYHRVALTRTRGRRNIPLDSLAARGAWAIASRALQQQRVLIPGYYEFVAGVLGVPGWKSTAVSDFANLAYSASRPVGYFSYNATSRLATYSGMSPADFWPDPEVPYYSRPLLFAAMKDKDDVVLGRG
jgi:hypothetical protein